MRTTATSSGVRFCSGLVFGQDAGIAAVLEDREQIDAADGER